MVRYSAPDEEGDIATSMEWAAIPDKHVDEDEMISDSFNQISLGPSHRKEDGKVSNGSHVGISFNGQEIIRICDSGSQDDAEFSRHNVDDSSSAGESTQIAFTVHKLSQSIQTIHEDHIQSIDHTQLVEQHHHRKRTRLHVFAILIVFVAWILYTYAPPPPPLRSTLFSKSFSRANSEFVSMITNFVGVSTSVNSIHSDQLSVQMQQYDSWTSYCQDTLQMFTEASLYQLAVFWYALSNAFLYATYEIRLPFVNFIDHFFEPTPQDTVQAAVHKRNAFSKSWCPIRIPFASSRHISLSKDTNTCTNNRVDSNLLCGMTTEEFLRQSIGASLSPQNLALTLLAEGIDGWGQNLIKTAPPPLVHRMATAVDTGMFTVEDNDNIYVYRKQWILPPAMGILLVGPEGVGKLHTARLLSHWLFDHCTDSDKSQYLHVDAVCDLPSTKTNNHVCTHESNGETLSSPQELHGVLDIKLDEYSGTHQDDNHQVKDTILKHIIQREHQGSVIILHHIEVYPQPLLTELFHVINGKSDVLTYAYPDGREVSVSTNGTVFIFTSKQWGIKNIFEEIQRNGMRTNASHKKTLLNDLRWEVDSHFENNSKSAKQLTIAPFLPLQQEDLKSILRSRIQYLSMSHEGLIWKQLYLSNAALDYYCSTDHIEYFDLFRQGNGDSSTITFSLMGANALEGNALMHALHSKLVSGTERRPYKVAFVDVVALDDGRWETVLAWCGVTSGLSETCEEEWRLVLN